MTNIQAIGALIFGAIALLLIGGAAIVNQNDAALLTIVIATGAAYGAQLCFYWYSMNAWADAILRVGNVLWVICILGAATSLFLSIWS